MWQSKTAAVCMSTERKETPLFHSVCIKSATSSGWPLSRCLELGGKIIQLRSEPSLLCSDRGLASQNLSLLFSSLCHGTITNPQWRTLLKKSVSYWSSVHFSIDSSTTMLGCIFVLVCICEQNFLHHDSTFGSLFYECVQQIHCNRHLRAVKEWWLRVSHHSKSTSHPVELVCFAALGVLTWLWHSGPLGLNLVLVCGGSSYSAAHTGFQETVLKATVRPVSHDIQTLSFGAAVHQSRDAVWWACGFPPSLLGF